MSCRAAWTGTCGPRSTASRGSRATSPRRPTWRSSTYGASKGSWAFDRIEDTRRQIQRAARVPLGALDRASAVFRSVRRGLDVYHRLGSLQAQARGRARTYREDEHLFI